MAKNVVSIKGMDKVLSTLKKLSNPDELLDEALRETAQNSFRGLVAGSQTKNPKIKGMNTGNTARAWTNPLKVGKGKYRTTNNSMTSDRKHLIVDIINKGHGEILPKRGEFLYIPLNKKAAQKRTGEPIPKEFKRGQDFVFARRVEARDGSNFMDDNVANASRELTRRVIAKIRQTFRSGV